MNLLDRLQLIWKNTNHPFLIKDEETLLVSDILSHNNRALSKVKSGDVVALIGDFTSQTISTFLRLIDLGAIVVPLTIATQHDHEYFFESALVDIVINGECVTRRDHQHKHELIGQLKRKMTPGLILFSTGTTGRPKAILHDLSLFLKRFETPRPALRTLSFLLFDHIGGLNTLLHILFNKGVIIVPQERTLSSVLDACIKHSVEVLPTTPTFLRMLVMSDVVEKIPSCLKVITYGTERMDQPTLDALCDLLPNVDFRQTFGMSELGILRIKSQSRSSLYMKIGGEGVETKVVEDVLYIRSQTRMLGYLNAEFPFDLDGWYNTKDLVKRKDEYYKIVGRVSDVINVGGLKFMPTEIEQVALTFPGVFLVKVIAKSNPITGQHVELIVQPKEECIIDRDNLINYLKLKLQAHMVPRRIKIENVSISHRFKRT